MGFELFQASRTVSGVIPSETVQVTHLEGTVADLCSSDPHPGFLPALDRRPRWAGVSALVVGQAAAEGGRKTPQSKHRRTRGNQDCKFGPRLFCGQSVGVGVLNPFRPTIQVRSRVWANRHMGGASPEKRPIGTAVLMNTPKICFQLLIETRTVFYILRNGESCS